MSDQDVSTVILFPSCHICICKKVDVVTFGGFDVSVGFDKLAPQFRQTGQVYVY